MLCHLDDVPWETHEHGDLSLERQRLSAAAGASDIGLSRYLIAAGCRAMPLHVHADEEEIFLRPASCPRSRRGPPRSSRCRTSRPRRSTTAASGTRRDLGRAAGSTRSGLVHVTVAPLARSAPHHCHSVEEELFVVLDGDGFVMLGDERHPLRAGSIVARPPATGIAHTFEAGEDGLMLLAYGTRDPSDMCWYPDSSKVSFCGLKVIARIQALDYWDGEP